MSSSQIPQTALNKDELKALAMHELMKREQARYAARIDEQRKITGMTDSALKAIVNGDKTNE